MILYNDPLHSTLPGALICQPACLLSFPSSVEVEDSWLNGGSGIGNGSSSIKSALGEYFERRHFYMEVKPDVVGWINFSLNKEEANQFLHAFFQTNDSNLTLAELSGHVFNLTKVYRTSDFSTCYIPTACISLSYRGNESEAAIYPSRDTCGCSFHWKFEQAAFGALKESLERQFLTKFWVTKKCLGLISEEFIKKGLNGSQAEALYYALNKAGEVVVIDISDPDYPGVCLLTVYGQKDKRRHVRYCAGMAYAETADAALEKSICELWQTYRFINLFEALGSDAKEVEDSYLRYFLSCNTYETFQEVTSISASVNIASKPLQGVKLSGLFSRLKEQEINGYLYASSAIINNEPFYFCKFVSPDLFLHMDNSKNINIYNKYSRGFIDQILLDRKKVMVPFP